jgi:hypothetical protein
MPAPEYVPGAPDNRASIRRRPNAKNRNMPVASREKFSSPVLHLERHDRWRQESPRHVKERRHFIAQNARCLVLAAAGQWPK